MIELIADFICFSIIGYIGEVIYCGLNKRQSGKGLRGPWCPLYGIGGTFILYTINNYPKNIFVIYLLGVILASMTEYATSVILEMIFKRKWWDYSNKKYNLNGRISLDNSLLFGVLALVLFYIYLPLKEVFLSNINPNLFFIVVTLLAFLLFIDLLFTIFEAAELKYRFKIVDENGLKNKEKLKGKLKKVKEYFDFKRLLTRFDFGDEKGVKFLKKYYKIKEKNKE